MIEGSMDWHGDKVMSDLQRMIGSLLLRVAVTYETEHRKRVSKPNTGRRRKRTRDTAAGAKGSQYTDYPNPSKAGEYMKVRTGFGRGNLTHEPRSAQEVARTGEVRVGFLKPGWYMPYLELYQRRKGLIDTLRDMQGELNAVASVERL